MPRRPTPGPGETTHLTVRCNNREFLLNPEENYHELVSWTNCLPICFNVDLHHVLFMSNHMHIILTPRRDNLGLAMSYFLTNLTKYLNYRLARDDHIFGGRYRPTVIKNSEHYINAIRYLYQNPLHARMVKSVRDYQFSSLFSYVGEGNDGLFLTADEYTKELFDLGLDGRQKWIDWIEEDLSDTDLKIMQRSLGKSVFKFTKSQFYQMREAKTTLQV